MLIEVANCSNVRLRRNETKTELNYRIEKYTKQQKWKQLLSSNQETSCLNHKNRLSVTTICMSRYFDDCHKPLIPQD